MRAMNIHSTFWQHISLVFLPLVARGKPYLPRLLRRSRIMVRKSVKRVEYHGKRALYYLATQLAHENMQMNLRVLYDFLRGGLSPHFVDQRKQVA